MCERWCHELLMHWKMSEKRACIDFIRQFGCLTLWWQCNSIGRSMKVGCTPVSNLHKWCITCKSSVVRFTSYGATPTVHDICCSVLNFDLANFLLVFCLTLVLFLDIRRTLKLSRAIWPSSMSIFERSFSWFQLQAIKPFITFSHYSFDRFA